MDIFYMRSRVEKILKRIYKDCLIIFEPADGLIYVLKDVKMKKKGNETKFKVIDEIKYSYFTHEKVTYIKMNLGQIELIKLGIDASLNRSDEILEGEDDD